MTFTIRDIHIIFWLNFNRINFPFVICRFGSNANKMCKKYQNLKYVSVKCSMLPYLVLFSPKTNADETPTEL